MHLQKHKNKNIQDNGGGYATIVICGREAECEIEQGAQIITMGERLLQTG